MPYLLKLLNETHSAMPFRVIGDVASKEHRFDWSDQHQAYCYRPQSQLDSDNIMAIQWTITNFPYRISPVIDNSAPGAPVAAPAPSTLRIPPYVRPELYANYPLLDLQMMFQNEGITPEGDVKDEHNLRHQLHRYYEGRAWGIEDVRRAREESAKLREQLTAALSKPVVASAPAPAATPKPAPGPYEPKGMDKAAKARAARSANAAQRRLEKQAEKNLKAREEAAMLGVPVVVQQPVETLEV